MQKNKKNDPFSEKELTEQPNQEDFKPEKLNSKNQKLAEPLKICIPEEILEKIFSKRWQFKEEGLNWVETQISRLSPTKEDFLNLYVSFFGVLNYTLKDKITQIIMKSMKILISLLKIQTGKIAGKNEMVMYLDNILVYVIEKISESNKTIKEISETTFFELCKSSAVGLQLSINSLIKCIDQKKQNLLPKLIVVRLKLLEKLIEIYKMNSDMNFTLISEFIIRNLDYSNQDVRNTAQEVLKALIKTSGEDKIKPLLLSWNQNYYEILRLDPSDNDRIKKIRKPNNGKKLK